MKMVVSSIKCQKEEESALLKGFHLKQFECIDRDMLIYLCRRISGLENKSEQVENKSPPVFLLI